MKDENVNKYAKKEFEEIKEKNKILEDKIAEISGNRKLNEMNIQKVIYFQNLINQH